jgi:multiple sugar transport system permease protein
MKSAPVINVLLGLGAAAMLFPFLWMLSLSIKPEDEIFTASPVLVPAALDLHNYVEAFSEGHVGTFMLNGVMVTGMILLLQYATIVPAAYVFAFKRFRLKELLFAVVLGVLLIPPHVTAIPNHLLLGSLGLLNTQAALVVPFATSAFGIFLLRQSFMTTPQELLDAARVDGASELHTLWAVVVPMSLPALTAFGVFSVVVHWNDFFWPLLVVTDLEKMTPPLGISIFASDEGGNEVGPMMAAATIIVLPLVAAFLFARRRFVEGVAMTGLKS